MAPADGAGHHLLAGLNAEQLEAVTTESHPLCILAGAGSGKTRVLTRRVAYRISQGTASPQHVLALTFTRRAAGQLASRLGRLGIRDRVAAGTFHSLAFSQLRGLWASRDEHPPAILERKARLLVPLLPRRPPGSAGEPGASRQLQAVDVASEIEWAKARMVSPAQYAKEAESAGRKPPVALEILANLYQRYEEEKRRRKLVDFDDLLLLCAVALETDADFAAAQRWRFRHLFVDEFQDVNPVQFRLLQGWRGDNPDLCVVGDPNQAIYSWNGADPRYLTQFANHFDGAVTLRLDDNYRSSPQVLGVANAILASGPRTTGSSLRPHQPDGPLPTVKSYSGDVEEARGVVWAIRRRHGTSAPWSQHAVLARTHAQLVLFEEALRAAKVPFRIRGGAAFLDQPDIKEALAQMGRVSHQPLVNALPDLREAAGPDRPAGQLVADEGGDDPLSERRRNIEGLIRLAEECLATDPSASIGGFLAWLRATLGRDEPDSGGDAVELATFHAAKGLEWPVVFVVGLEQGLMPIGRAETPEAKAEERRLLYVAVTRAQRELNCSWAERRTFGTRSMGRSPSPYLSTIEAAVAAIGEGGVPVDWREFLEANRNRLRASAGGPSRSRRASAPRAGDDADPVVLEALKSWRATTARASGVPAFVVFHDTTLAAVAEVKPRSRAALLALPGMGPVKAQRYGDAVLAVVASHAER